MESENNIFSPVGKTRLIGSKPLWSFLHPVRYYLISSAILSAIAALAGLMPYIAIAEIIRDILTSTEIAAQSQKIWAWIIIGLSGACIRLFLMFFSSQLGHYGDAEVLHSIRGKIIRHLGVLPIGWFRTYGSGTVKKVMTNDLEEMHQLIAHSAREMIAAVMAIGVSLTYLFIVDVPMTFVVISVLTLMLVFYQVAMRSVTLHMNNLLAAETAISLSSIEYADGITVVKTFGSGGMILQRFGKAVDSYTRAMRDWVGETEYSSAATRLLSSEMTLLGVIMFVGLFQISSGRLLFADLLPFLVLGIGLPTSIVPAVHGAIGLRKGRLSAANIQSVLEQKDLAEPTVPQKPLDYGIKFDRVYFSYDGTHRAIEHINITFAPNTITALVGPSGAGKSTIANLIPRFYEVSSGSISIGGVDIRSIASVDLLASMSLVFQDVILLRETVRENIRIGRTTATDEEVYQVAKMARIHEVIEALPDGYNTMLGTGESGLSGGEMQRLTIARAMLSGAPIVILDEATAAVDTDNEIQIQEALAVLARGKTVIVVAHRLYTIMNADQILVFNKGRLEASGNHSSLMKEHGLYSRMWQAQLEGVAK